MTASSDTPYQHLFDAAPDLLMLIRRDGLIQLANVRCEEVLGLAASAVQGRNLQDLLDAAHRSDFEVLMTGVADGTAMPEFEVVLEGEKGRVPMMLEVRPTSDDGADLLVRLRDLREIKVLEQEYRNLFESIADAVFIGDPETGQIYQANRSACEMTGYGLGELMGQDYDRVHVEAWSELLDEAKKTGGRILSSRESSLRGKDGREVPVEIHLRLVPRGDNEEVYIETLIDISERKRLERRMHDLRNEWDAFMRHELRSPLTPILAFSQLLMEDYPEIQANEKMMQYLDSIWQGGKRLERLLDLTREVQQYERGEIPMATIDGDVLRTVEDAANEAAMGVDSEKGTTESRVTVVRPGDGSLTIRYDPHLLQRAVANLVKNALEHDPGEVTVTVDGDESGIWIAVHNDGEPIPPDRVDTIFEKFNTTKRNRKGTGLGTTIAKLFVAAHGGDIDVRSSRNEGTTFTIRLPRDGAASGT